MMKPWCTSSSSIGAPRRVASLSPQTAPGLMATSVAWLLLLGLSSSIGAADAESLECYRGTDYGYMQYSAYAETYLNAIAPGYSFKQVRPRFIQPAKQPNYPPIH